MVKVSRLSRPEYQVKIGESVHKLTEEHARELLGELRRALPTENRSLNDEYQRWLRKSVEAVDQDPYRPYWMTGSGTSAYLRSS